jgi:hypothetical protein
LTSINAPHKNLKNNLPLQRYRGKNTNPVQQESLNFELHGFFNNFSRKHQPHRKQQLMKKNHLLYPNGQSLSLYFQTK